MGSPFRSGELVPEDSNPHDDRGQAKLLQKTGHALGGGARQDRPSDTRTMICPGAGDGSVCFTP
jgi:hypothetical protein